jgi:hypothetical protein
MVPEFHLDSRELLVSIDVEVTSNFATTMYGGCHKRPITARRLKEKTK